MRDMDKAVARLIKAKIFEEKVLVYGDYDVDGTTSVSMLALYLEEWGFAFDYYIPDRYKEGYGVSFQGIDYAEEQGVKLIIALDCGIKAHEEVLYAKEKGIDFIICDHHLVDEEQSLPQAAAILNPKQPNCPYPCKELTGCGIGLKFIQAATLAQIEMGELMPSVPYDPFVKYSGLATLSIACDIVPIVDENRVIAYYGIRQIQSNPLPGIKAIKELATNERKWNIADVVFFIGPRVNSVGRLGSAMEAVRVLSGKSKQLPEWVKQLETSNQKRKDIDRKTVKEALSLIESDASFAQKATTVLYHPAWHKGVIGIVASRLIERFYRPTILLTESAGKLVGSARSVRGFDLYAALDACRDYLLQFGGHKYAAGMTMAPEALPHFMEAFDTFVQRNITQESKVPVLFIEHVLKFDEIDERFIKLIHRMSPFGPQNPTPVFASKEVEVLHARILKEEHISFFLKQGSNTFRAIGFNMAEKWSKISTNYLHIAYQPMLNTWKGKTSIQLQLKDFKAVLIHGK